MGAALAAAYMGVSQTTLLSRVKARTYPQPIKEGGKVLWSKVQLDAFIAAQFGLPSSANDSGGDETWADLR